MSSPAPDSELRQAVAAWIEAHWQFKNAPDRYSAKRVEAYVSAERKLRRACTGKGDLEKAYAVILEQS